MVSGTFRFEPMASVSLPLYICVPKKHHVGSPPIGLYILTSTSSPLDTVGILLVSKCLSSAAIVDTLLRSEKYRPEFYIVEKQPNPFNRSRAKSHAVVPDLALDEVVKFAKKFSDKIAFGLTDTEDFVVAGGRDVVGKETGVEMLCVAKKFAVEGSKVEQRLLFDRVFKGANPNYRVFDPENSDSQEALASFRRTAAEMNGVVIKPDAPTRGAGVGVWGKDFSSGEEASAFFLNAFSKGRVVVEERVDGEESSFQAFSDGKHFVPGPLTRDYKRSLEGNAGRLTGGMGSYRDSRGLPFLSSHEWEHLSSKEETAFRRWKGRGSEPGLRGIVLYDAIMHTGRGFKVLERNSRGGNTEVINLLTTIADDLVDVCFRILDGSLKRIRFSPEASVVACAVPLSYGIQGAPGPDTDWIDLTRAYRLSKKLKGTLRIFPMDVREEGSLTRIGTSRSVAIAGIGKSLAEARALSIRGLRALSGPLRWRNDIASEGDIEASSAHMASLRREA